MKSMMLRENTRTHYGSLSKGLAKISYAQFGEDVTIMNLLRNVAGGFYLDIGAHDPFHGSNTALLYLDREWRGINIDLNQRYIDLLNEHRPRDINLCFAMGDADREIEAVIFERGALSTVDPSRQARLIEREKNGERRTVKMRTIPSLLREYLPPGEKVRFLNLDVEGIDFATLSANDWDLCRPDVIAVETHGMDLHDPTKNNVFNLLVSKGYRFHSHIHATSIFKL